MKRSWRMRVALLITALGVSVPVMAQTQSGPKPARTPAEAFEAGKDFARTNQRIAVLLALRKERPLWHLPTI